MMHDNFGYAGSDGDRRESGEWSQPEDPGRIGGVDIEALERWLSENHSLWRLGVRLAEAARQYRKEYRHVPFNQSGWFSPN